MVNFMALPPSEGMAPPTRPRCLLPASRGGSDLSVVWIAEHAPRRTRCVRISLRHSTLESAVELRAVPECAMPPPRHCDDVVSFASMFVIADRCHAPGSLLRLHARWSAAFRIPSPGVAQTHLLSNIGACAAQKERSFPASNTTNTTPSVQAGAGAVVRRRP